MFHSFSIISFLKVNKITLEICFLIARVCFLSFRIALLICKLKLSTLLKWAILMLILCKISPALLLNAMTSELNVARVLFYATNEIVFALKEAIDHATLNFGLGKKIENLLCQSVIYQAPAVWVIY